MYEPNFRIYMMLLLLSQAQWRANYAVERIHSEWFDFGGES